MYANTLYEPGEAFYQDPRWSHITDWKAELAPYYDLAKRMLGVVTNPTVTPADEVMRSVARQMGVEHTFRLTPVGVFFGDKPQGSKSVRNLQPQPDPYFGGVGPQRTPCCQCGACMTGCRYNAKNTLVKNYLYLAEKLGTKILALTTVTRILPQGNEQGEQTGYAVHMRSTGRHWAGWQWRRKTRVIHADHVIMAAGALGTVKLLLAMRDSGDLPNLSGQLGKRVRTNSESLVGAVGPLNGPVMNRGVAITSSFHLDENTHVEPARYGDDSNLMAAVLSPLTDGIGPGARWKTWLREMWRQRDLWWSLKPYKDVARRGVIALVMQNLDNSLTLFTKRSRLTGRRVLTSRQGIGEPNPTWIPAANEAARLMAKKMGGMALGNLGEQFDRPVTAHFLGGADIGITAQEGVADPWLRVYGHPGLHVVDGAAVGANLGVNPSLTITAQAERAMAYWPNKGEADLRPPVGASTYSQIPSVAPKRPAVPADAPAAIRLPHPVVGTIADPR